MTGGRPEASDMSCEATRRAVEHSNAISATFVGMPIVNDPVAVTSASNRHMWIYWIALVQNTRHRQTTRHHYALPLRHAPGQSCLTKQGSATPRRALQPWLHRLFAPRKGHLSTARTCFPQGKQMRVLSGPTKQSSATPMRALQPWFHHLLASRKGLLSIARM